GVVYRGRAPDGKDVAIKLLLRPDVPSVLERFARERRLLAALSQAEGFVPLLDHGDSPEGPYVVMPFVEGGTLEKRLEQGPLAIDDAVALARTLAAAMA